MQPTAAERRSAESERGGSYQTERRRHREPRAQLPGNMKEGWLVFQTKGEKRRLAPLPDGWDEFSDDQLICLLDHATLLGPPRRLIE